MAPPQIDRAESDAVLQELRRREDEDDCENFHHYELDAEHRLNNLFWANVDSRLGYLFHGDVVVFDTTYRTNKYGMPFVPFVGLTHHHTPAFFGCGIISDQSLDSYVWLLRAFLTPVHERPKSVITDGGDAVVAAVKIVCSRTPTTGSARGTWSRPSRSTSMARRPGTSSGPWCATRAPSAWRLHDPAATSDWRA